MSISDKISPIFNASKETLEGYDSRKECKTKYFEKEDAQNIRKFIDEKNTYTTFKKCFLNHVFVSEIADYFGKPKKYVDCEIEICDLYICANFLSFNSFKRCTFYMSNYNEASFFAVELSAIEKDSFVKKNTVIKKSYIEFLSDLYEKDLRKTPYNLLNGIFLKHSNLKDTILPDNNDFFENLNGINFANVVLGDIDFNKYTLPNITFNNVTFGENSILSDEVLSKGLFNCTLPKIDFSKYSRDTLGKFTAYNCKFHKETIFPELKGFFCLATIKGSEMPPYDYSQYYVQKNTFGNCTFTDDSILPEMLFTYEFIETLENIKTIPSKYINEIALYSEMKYPKRFLDKYIDKLSTLSLYVLSKKYNLNLRNA